MWWGGISWFSAFAILFLFDGSGELFLISTPCFCLHYNPQMSCPSKSPPYIQSGIVLSQDYYAKSCPIYSYNIYFAFSSIQSSNPSGLFYSQYFPTKGWTFSFWRWFQMYFTPTSQPYPLPSLSSRFLAVFA